MVGLTCATHLANQKPSYIVLLDVSLSPSFYKMTCVVRDVQLVHC